MLAGIGAVLAMPFRKSCATPLEERLAKEGSPLVGLDFGREPIIVKGPTPKYLIKGDWGYCATRPPTLVSPYTKWGGVETRVLLNGVDVSNRCNEADLIAQWARLYDVNPDGSIRFYDPNGTFGWHRVMKVYPPVPHSEFTESLEVFETIPDPDYGPIERIHFGEVKVIDIG